MLVPNPYFYTCYQFTCVCLSSKDFGLAATLLIISLLVFHADFLGYILPFSHASVKIFGRRIDIQLLPNHLQHSLSWKIKCQILKNTQFIKEGIHSNQNKYWNIYDRMNTINIWKEILKATSPFCLISITSTHNVTYLE